MESLEMEVCTDASKRDSRGRRIFAPGERERLIGAYRESGLTQKAYCRREGINLHTFIGWLSIERAAKRSAKKPKEVFREVQLRDAISSSRAPLEVRLPGGEVVRGEDAEAVAKLVVLLRG